MLLNCPIHQFDGLPEVTAGHQGKLTKRQLRKVGIDLSRRFKMLPQYLLFGWSYAPDVGFRSGIFRLCENEQSPGGSEFRLFTNNPAHDPDHGRHIAIADFRRSCAAIEVKLQGLWSQFRLAGRYTIESATKDAGSSISELLFQIGLTGDRLLEVARPHQ